MALDLEICCRNEQVKRKVLEIAQHVSETEGLGINFDDLGLCLCGYPNDELVDALLNSFDTWKMYILNDEGVVTFRTDKWVGCDFAFCKSLSMPRSLIERLEAAIVDPDDVNWGDSKSKPEGKSIMGELAERYVDRVKNGEFENEYRLKMAVQQDLENRYRAYDADVNIYFECFKE